MNENQTLREQMWDLCYGLLSADEVAALHKQIKSDPAAARLYAEVRLQADLVASAAKVEDPSVSLSVPDEGRKVQSAAKKHSGESRSSSHAASRSEKQLQTPSYRAGNWLAGLAALALVALVGYGFFGQSPLSGVQADNLVVAQVYAPTPLQAGLTQNFKVLARNTRGEPAKAYFVYTLKDSSGKVTLSDQVQSNASGEAQLPLPGKVVQPGSSLELVAVNGSSPSLPSQNERLEEQNVRSLKFHEANASKMVVALSVKDEPVETDVTLQKDWYQPGETVRAHVHSWGAFSKQPATVGSDWKLAMDGLEVAPSAVTAQPAAGMAELEFQLPTEAPTGFYRLVATNPQTGTSRDLEHVPVGQDVYDFQKTGKRSELLAMRFRREVGEGQRRNLQQQMEPGGVEKLATNEAEKKLAEKNELRQSGGGKKPESLAATAPPSAPSTAGSAAPAPKPHAALPRAAMPLTPAPAPLALPADPTDKDKSKSALAGALPAKEGTVESGRFESAQPEDHLLKRSGAAGDGERSLASVQVQGDSLSVQVPAALAGRQLLVIARKLGTPVAQQTIQASPPTDEKKAARQATDAPASATPLATEELGSRAPDVFMAPIKVLLPPEADGKIGVTIYDQSSQPPQMVLTQEVERTNSHALQIEARQETSGTMPQQEVRFNIRITDGEGRQVPESYWSAQLVKADDPLGRELSGSGEMKLFADGGRPTPSGTLEPAPEALLGQKKELDDVKMKDASEREAKFKEAQENKQQSAMLRSKKSALSAAPGGAPPGVAGGALPPAALASDHEKPRALNEYGAIRSESEALMESAELGKEVAVPPLVLGEELLASSDAQVQQAIRAGEEASQAQLADFHRLVGRLVLVGAAAALLLFGALAILHRPAQAKVWVPAMAVVAASFVIGCVWWMSGQAQRKNVAARFDEAPRENQPAEFFKDHAQDAIASSSSYDAAPAETPSAAEPASVDALGMGVGGGKGPSGGGKSSGLGGFGGGGGGRGIADKRDEGTKPPVAEGKPLSGPQTEASPLPSEPSKPAAKGRKAETTEMKSLEKLDGAPANAPRGDNAKGAADAKEPRSDPREKASKDRAVTDRADLSRKAADDLYWKSGLPANERGEAALDLRLPAEEGDYWLVINVQGPNGVGKLQKRIPVRVPPAAPAKP